MSPIQERRRLCGTESYSSSWLDGRASSCLGSCSSFFSICKEPGLLRMERELLLRL